MDKIFPRYAENIIVGVLFQNQWQWFLTEKEIWVLDYEKEAQAFQSKGYVVNPDYLDDCRQDLWVIDTKEKAQIFLDRLQARQIDRDFLREGWKKAIQADLEEGYLDYLPSFLVDFDQKHFYSMYPEPGSYEDFLPEGWQGNYIEFLDKVPKKERYWFIE